MATYLNPTLLLTSTAGSTGTSEDASLVLSVTDQLTVTDTSIGLSRVACTTTGGATVILPSATATRFLYIKNIGFDADDAATTAHLKVETGDGARIIELAADEFCWLPYKNESGGTIQLEASATLPDGATASSGTIIAEYGYWTKY